MLGYFEFVVAIVFQVEWEEGEILRVYFLDGFH